MVQKTDIEKGGGGREFSFGIMINGGGGGGNKQTKIHGSSHSCFRFFTRCVNFQGNPYFLKTTVK